MLELGLFVAQLVPDVLQLLQAGQNRRRLGTSSWEIKGERVSCVQKKSYGAKMDLQEASNGRTSADALTSTQGALGIKDVPPKSDSLGHHLLVKSHSFGVV